MLMSLYRTACDVPQAEGFAEAGFGLVMGRIDPIVHRLCRESRSTGLERPWRKFLGEVRV
jgi:hypothetical protein